jgi:hypothetical protein
LPDRSGLNSGTDTQRSLLQSIDLSFEIGNAVFKVDKLLPEIGESLFDELTTNSCAYQCWLSGSGSTFLLARKADMVATSTVSLN